MKTAKSNNLLRMAHTLAGRDAGEDERGERNDEAQSNHLIHPQLRLRTTHARAKRPERLNARHKINADFIVFNSL